MAVWAIADLHLSFGVPNKTMDVFGEQWRNHPQKIEENWHQLIQEDDLVLLAGDISWALRPEEVAPDLAWIDKLPGTKVMIRGNHDYWWGSLAKVRSLLPASIHAIYNDVFTWQDYSIGGARLWDTPEFGFNEHIEFVENSVSSTPKPGEDDDNAERLAQTKKIFERELHRLELSLQKLNNRTSTETSKGISKRLVMTHYPPLGAEMEPSRASALLEKYGVDVCVFGHLHNVQAGQLPYGEKRGVRYVLTAADYLDFKPKLILP